MKQVIKAQHDIAKLKADISRMEAKLKEVTQLILGPEFLAKASAQEMIRLKKELEAINTEIGVYRRKLERINP